MKKVLRCGVALLLALFLPVSALAGGTWRTMKEDPTEDEMMVVTSEYTGDVTITWHRPGDVVLSIDPGSGDWDYEATK